MLMFALMVQLSAPLFIAIGPYSIKCIQVVVQWSSGQYYLNRFLLMNK